MEASPKPPCDADYSDPWRLFVRALALGGKQVVPLLLAFWKICDFNPKHYRVASYCGIEEFGQLAYVCEGTKAFARCFPLLAISVSLVVIGRFMLQSRIHYLLIMKKVILDFHNYKFYKDPAVILLISCFSLGMLHFMIDFCLPPYLYDICLEKVEEIGTFVLPCAVFFLVFESGCNIERHLVTINKFYEDDVARAEEQLAGAKMITENEFRKSVATVQSGMDKDDQHSIDLLLDKAILKTQGSRGELFEPKPDVHVGLFRGLWPGQILLASRIMENDSKKFKKFISVYMLVFGLVHAFILIALMLTCIEEIDDALPKQLNSTKLHQRYTRLSGILYEELGAGYCRDESMQSPDSYWRELRDPNFFHIHESIARMPASSRSWKGQPEPYGRNLMQPGASPLRAEVGGRAAGFLAISTYDLLQQAGNKSKISFPEWHVLMCAEQCGSESSCIGFSLSKQFCTIYTSHSIKAPHGWTQGAESNARSASVRRSAHIVQTSKYEKAACWKKAKTKGEPQDIAGGMVSVLHVFIVICIMGNVFANMWPAVKQ